MSVLDYLRGFTNRDTAPPPSYDASRFSLTQQYPGAGEFSGFSLTGPPEMPYGQPQPPTLLTPEQQAFANGPVPSGASATPATQPSGTDLSQLAGLIGSGLQAGQAVGAAAAGPTVDQQVFTTHFGAQGGQQQPFDINAIPPEMQQFLQVLMQNGGFQ